MATDRAKIRKLGCLAVAIETTTGTAATVSAADAAINVFDIDFQPDQPMNARPRQASKGQLAGVAGAKPGTLKFSVELSGSGASGAVPLWASRCLPACGMNDSGGTFSFLDTSEVTDTLVWYADGLKNTLVGAKGTFTISGEDGGRAMVNFEFRGKHTAEADDTLLSPTFPTVVPVACKGTTFTLHSVTPKISKFEINAGNELVLREDMTDATGYHAAEIVTMAPTMTLDPEAVAVATKDWTGIRDASTSGSFNFVLGTVTYNVVTIAASDVTVNKAPLADRNGLLTRALECQFNGASPFTIAFT